MAELHTWIEADGTEHPINLGEQQFVIRGRSGRYAPRFEFAADPVPTLPGTSLRQVQVSERGVDLGLAIVVQTDDEARDLLASMASWFDPIRGDGTYRVARGDRARELVCRYAGGIDEAERVDSYGPGWFLVPVSLRTFEEPYWLDTEFITHVVSGGAAATAFFPILPLTLVETTAFADFTINNDGDAEAWPQWEITGPGTNPVLANVTTGKSLSFTHTLAAGQQILIDTRPRRKTVVDQNDTSLFTALGTNPKLWPLARGENVVHVTMSGTTSESSLILNYKRRWLAP